MPFESEKHGGDGLPSLLKAEAAFAKELTVRSMRGFMLPLSKLHTVYWLIFETFIPLEKIREAAGQCSAVEAPGHTPPKRVPLRPEASFRSFRPQCLAHEWCEGT